MSSLFFSFGPPICRMLPSTPSLARQHESVASLKHIATQLKYYTSAECETAAGGSGSRHKQVTLAAGEEGSKAGGDGRCSRRQRQQQEEAAAASVEQEQEAAVKELATAARGKSI